MLLVVTNRSELAADYLIIRLRERQVPFRRFNTEELGSTVLASIWLTPTPDGLLTFADGLTLALREVRGVYFHHPQPPSTRGQVVDAECEFADSELLETLRTLWRVIPPEKWLSHPYGLWLADNKVEQLIRARACGLKIPETIIASHTGTIKRFHADHAGQIVVKAVKHGFVNREGGLSLAGTRRVSAQTVEELAKFAPIPAVYQEEVPKDVDLRVVVVRTKVFPVEVDIADEFRAVDWRIAELTGHRVHYSPFALPRNVEGACIELVHSFGLSYASIDMIRSAAGEYVFLELNPTGQWAWLEQLTGVPIRDALIDALLAASAP